MFIQWKVLRDTLTDKDILQIETLEGVMEAQVGDWIIQGLEGEYYPCKDSVFEKKYRRKSMIDINP